MTSRRKAIDSPAVRVSLPGLLVDSTVVSAFDSGSDAPARGNNAATKETAAARQITAGNLNARTRPDSRLLRVKLAAVHENGSRTAHNIVEFRGNSVQVGSEFAAKGNHHSSRVGGETG